jgi:hypothetical protein
LESTRRDGVQPCCNACRDQENEWFAVPNLSIFIFRVEGRLSNVVGLPLAELLDLLAKL